MSRGSRALVSVGLLVALATALSLSPVGFHRAGGEAQAASAANPIKTLDQLLNALRDLRGLPEFRLPKIWKPPVATTTQSYKNFLRRSKAARVGERLQTEIWTCDAAEFLEGVEKINSFTKAVAASIVEQKYGITDRDATQFVEQSAELGQSLITKLVRASC